MRTWDILDAQTPEEALASLESIDQPGYIMDSRLVQYFGELAVDRRFTVEAQGVELSCGPLQELGALCGQHLYTFTLVTYVAASVDALADFSHTLSLDTLWVPHGAEVTFAPGQALHVAQLPVPEPEALALSATGLLAMWFRRNRFRVARRH